MPITRNEFKSITALVTRKGRIASGCFLAEGIRLLEEALRHGLLPEKVYFAPSMISPRGQELLDEMASRAVSLIQIQKPQLLKLADTETPQGIVGCFRTPDLSLTKLYRKKHRKILWCVDISDPGNLGTLIRSALAFGFELVVTSGRAADAFSPKVVRSSAGAIFGVPVARQDTSDVISFIREKKFQLVAAELGGKALDDNLRRQLKSKDIILAIGSEGDGLSPDIIKEADIRLRIEHSNRVESLNAAVAGSMIMSGLYNREG